MASEIKCPHCGTVFKGDESGFNDIVRQLRERELEKELRAQKNVSESEKAAAVQLAEAKLRGTAQKVLTEKDIEIAQLKSKIEAAETEKKLAVREAAALIEKESEELKSRLKSKDLEKEILEKSIKEKYEYELKFKDEEIGRLKDMKARLSTKLVGESLEQHCETEFEKHLRALVPQNTLFGKDNDAKSGSKGDYFYRETDESGAEIVSIMFEMKNEEDGTTVKKKNEDFLDKLNKDRVEKNCEYAVLVSLLEPDSELYNSGIVDKSHRYPKMYVIRPQFFVPMITILRNAALKSLKERRELALIRNQNADITTFEEDLGRYKGEIARKYELARDRFQDAISEIDKSIDRLQKVKEALMMSENHFRLADEKAGDLTIRKLTRANPTMAERFAELGEKNKAE